MDTDGVLARAPHLALVDELAHTNVPGMARAKRYEDVALLLQAGIDVMSTVNVQHLESLNDRVFELTGVRVRETIPDQVLLDADEVILVDLTPEALQARLRAGKVYPAERVESALLNFFTDPQPRGPARGGPPGGGRGGGRPEPALRPARARRRRRRSSRSG